MADNLSLTRFGSWDDQIWFDVTTGSLVAAGSDNDLNIGTGIGGAMTGDGAADSLQVAEPYPGFGSITFDGIVSVASFELSPSTDSATGTGLEIAGGDLVTSATLDVAQSATMEVDSAGALDSTGSPGLQDFGEIDINDGTVSADQASIFGTLDLIEGTGTFATLTVGSYTGEGGTGGTGVLTIDSGNSVGVSVALAVAVQTGTGTIDVDGGTLTVSGEADVGEAATGLLGLTDGGSISVTDTLDFGGLGGGSGTLLADGGGSTISANGGLVVGDAGSGIATISDGASVSVDGSLVIGATGGGSATVVSGGSVGVDGSLVVADSGTGTLTLTSGVVSVTGGGPIEIGASDGAIGSVGVSGVGASLTGNLLAVGGTGSGEGGSGLLSIGAGGNVSVSSADVWDTGVVALSGGTLTASPITVEGAVSGFGELVGSVTDNGAVTVNNGVLTVTGVVGGTGSVVFSGAATLVLEAPGTVGFAQMVSGLADGDRIELGGLTIENAQTTSPGTISVGLSNGVYQFTDVSFAAGASHVLETGKDTTTGDYYFEVACFAAGTSIAAPGGDVAVEDLRAGDQVALAGGGLAEVIWIGRREVDAKRHPEPRKVWPVRIAAGAFGTGRPYRDLFLSPDHAVFVENVLIPVKCLINGGTIAQVAVDRVTYYHVELACHDVLLAEGLPVESYLDTGDRRDFVNGGDTVRLHPAFSARAWEALGCAPLIVTGPELDGARRLVNSRAAEMARVGTGETRAA